MKSLRAAARRLITAARLVRCWRAGDKQDAGFALLVKAAKKLYPEYRFVDRPLDWWQSRPFIDYLERFGEEDSHSAYRRWMVAQLLRLTRNVSGDTAECGVYLGATSWLICASNRGTGRVHHAFDSFEGLSPPGPEDGGHWSEGNLAIDQSMVEEHLADFTDVRLYRGWIPSRFAEVADRCFSFVHIDVDLEQPTADSIAFFYPRLSRGGILVCDDYGFGTCPGATRAIDRFLAEVPERMLSLPQGGGFLIKGRPVEPEIRF